jgi:hypothetical protein
MDDKSNNILILLDYYKITPVVKSIIMDEYNNKFQKWYKNKYNIVLWELNRIFEVQKIYNYNISIFDILKLNQGNWRKYIILLHYKQLKKSFCRFIDLEHSLSYELDRKYITGCRNSEIDGIYVDKISSSFKLTKF